MITREELRKVNPFLPNDKSVCRNCGLKIVKLTLQNKWVHSVECNNPEPKWVDKNV